MPNGGLLGAGPITATFNVDQELNNAQNRHYN